MIFGLALVPLSKKSKGLYDTVNMLIKCIFYSAERSQLITDNPCVGISAKGGKADEKERCLNRSAGMRFFWIRSKRLPPYLFIMIGLYSGLRREEVLGIAMGLCISGCTDAIYFRETGMAFRA